jgi:glutathione S-transferase
MIYLADLFQDAGLAPALDDPLRGPYLRWMAFHGACFEPAVIDLALKREAAPLSMSPYGDYDTMLATLTLPEIAAYLARFNARKSVQQVAAQDAELVAAQAA